MIILAIDTSTPSGAIALSLPIGRSVRIARHDSARPHGRELLATIAGMFDSESLSPPDLQAIGIGLGPGSYTGLRIGVAAAKTIAFALGLPLVPLDTFDAIAANAPAGFLQIDVAMDAQRGDIFLARYVRRKSGGVPERSGPTEIRGMVDWAKGLGRETCVLGPTLNRFRVDWPIEAHVGPAELGHPNPHAMIDSAARRFEAGITIDPMLAEPFYLRRSAAEDQWENRP